jgi:cobyrinic acid a,c-diamide synthase
MNVTRQMVAEKLAAYLQRRLPLNELVDWAERQVMEADFESMATQSAVARLGLADVRAFGLTWEDCQRLLDSLGYTARVEIVA